ncbi:splicing regulator SDE2 [Conger conger]|uniref:splicing regulator SDE2 n=1 Tax=Conger conger TaxID=82655 RepID=UPI002A5AC99E|nr:splicing regulator SDE2 [Conger conger]
MEVLVTDFSQRLCQVHLSFGASVWHLTDVLSRERGIPHTDFYVKSNGRLLAEDEELQAGGWYRLEPRLCGGKGGFGSMLRALGAQIEKTTNREACRDLSGRRLRDVNHEKEMADWLKKQADREAEKEQRRLERLQRKLAEPKHYFSDPAYEKQCHDMSERMEESIKRGLQASSSGTSGVSRKRASPYGADPGKRPRLWQSGVDDLSSSEDDSEGSDEEASSSSSSRQESSSAPPPHRAARAPSSSSSSHSSPQRPPEETTEQETPMEPEAQQGTEPVTPRGAEPVTPRGAEPVAEREAEPVAEREAEPVAEREAEPVAEREAEPVAEREAEPVAEREAEPVVEKEAEPAVQTDAPAPDLSDTQQITQNAVGLSQAESTAAPNTDDAPLDLQTVGGAVELEALGLDRLKVELMGLGVKCGGTLQERAARLFSVRGLAKEQIPPALLAKPAPPRRK